MAPSVSWCVAAMAQLRSVTSMAPPSAFAHRPSYLGWRTYSCLPTPLLEAASALAMPHLTSFCLAVQPLPPPLLRRAPRPPYAVGARCHRRLRIGQLGRPEVSPSCRHLAARHGQRSCGAPQRALVDRRQCAHHESAGRGGRKGTSAKRGEGGEGGRGQAVLAGTVCERQGSLAASLQAIRSVGG